MKLFRLRAVIMFVLLCITASVILGQDNPAKPPTKPLVSCESVAMDETHPCDMMATRPEDIVGVWAVYFAAEPAFIRFNADGTWLIADTVEHTNAASAEGYPNGTFSFDKDGVFTTLDPNTPVSIMPEECRAGHYVLRVIKVSGKPVALNHVMLEDCFVPRRTDWAYTMLWVSSD
jgi:hypothetical protein